MAIFSGIQVSVGKNDFNSETNLVKIPVVHGSKDRVVAAILASNSPNIPVRLPTMACHLTKIQLDQEAFKGQGTENKNVEFPRGGVFPDDLKTVEKLMPVPYKFGAELSILTSNLDQKYQILEQIFLLFRPDLWFQTSDDHLDWTAITSAFLSGITLEENYPSGSDKRILSTLLEFEFTAYMSAPATIRENIIQKIKVRLKTLSGVEDFSKFKEEAASKSIDEEYTNIFDIAELDPPEN